MVVNNAAKAVGTAVTETSTSQFGGRGGLIFTNWIVSLSLQCLNPEAQACSYHGEGPGNGQHSHNPGLYFERVYCKGNLLCVIMYFLIIMCYYVFCMYYYVFSCYYVLCIYRETCTLFIFFAKTNLSEIVGVPPSSFLFKFYKSTSLPPWTIIHPWDTQFRREGSEHTS